MRNSKELLNQSKELKRFVDEVCKGNEELKRISTEVAAAMVGGNAGKLGEAIYHWGAAIAATAANSVTLRQKISDLDETVKGMGEERRKGEADSKLRRNGA